MAEEEQNAAFSMDGEFEFARRPHQTKEEQLYGVFGDEAEVRQQKAAQNKRTQHYKAMNFVSAGTGFTDKDAEKKEKKKADKVKLAQEKKKKQEARDKARGKVALTQLPTAFGAKRVSDDEALGIKQEAKRQKVNAADAAVGGFEKHTKGFGMKMLMKMGFKKGEGLGKTGGGVTQALETKLRPKGAGVGVIQEQSQVNIDQGKRIKRHHKAQVGEEYISTDEDSGEDDVEGEARQEAQVKEDRSTRWRKGGAKAKAPKTVYKTADEVAKAGVGAVEKTKIIDMRGPQARTIVNLSGLQTGGIPTGFEASGRSAALPELQHNMKCLIDEAELDIQDSDRKVRRLKDSIARTESEVGQLTEKVRAEDAQIQSVLATMELITHARQSAEAGEMNLGEVEKLFVKLKEEHAQEYRLFRLSRLAVALVFPLVAQDFSQWAPLSDPQRITRVLTPWKRLLQGSPSDARVLGGLELSVRILGRLLEDVVLPVIRGPLVNDWNLRDTAAGFDLFQALQEVFEPALFAIAVDQLLIPKLKHEVEAWNPLTDKVPIHQWLLPWLHLAGPEKLETLYPSIRHKLNGCLEMWEAKDPSAKRMLAPWHKVFDAQSWAGLMTRCIVPKLQAGLAMLRIDPSKQDVGAFKHAVDWAGLVEDNILVQLLLGEFFPKWHKALYTWMCGNPNFEEVQKWYQGWKSLFPPVLMGNSQIKQQFTKALDLMNAAVAGQDLSTMHPGMQENVTHLHKEQQRTFEKQAPAKSRERSFKEVVEDVAAEANYVLMPTKLQHDSGKAIYSFGPKLKVYLDNSVVFWQEIDKDNPNVSHWRPVGLDDIVELAHARNKPKK